METISLDPAEVERMRDRGYRPLQLKYPHRGSGLAAGDWAWYNFRTRDAIPIRQQEATPVPIKKEPQPAPKHGLWACAHVTNAENKLGLKAGDRVLVQRTEKWPGHWAVIDQSRKIRVVSEEELKTFIKAVRDRQGKAVMVDGWNNKFIPGPA